MFVYPEFAEGLTKLDIEIILLETDSELYFGRENIQSNLMFPEMMRMTAISGGIASATRSIIPIDSL